MDFSCRALRSWLTGDHKKREETEIEKGEKWKKDRSMVRIAFTARLDKYLNVGRLESQLLQLYYFFFATATKRRHSVWLFITIVLAQLTQKLREGKGAFWNIQSVYV